MWTSADLDRFAQLVDMLTGIFLNEKAARIRIVGYQHAVEAYDPRSVCAVLEDALHTAHCMPLPCDILQALLH